MRLRAVNRRPAGAPSAAAIFQIRDEVAARQPQRGSEAERDRADDGEHDRRRQDHQVRRRLGTTMLNGSAAASDAASARVAQELSTRPSAAPAAASSRLSVSSCRMIRARPRAERQPHGELLAPRRSAREQHVRDVETRDHQHDAGQRHQAAPLSAVGAAVVCGRRAAPTRATADSTVSTWFWFSAGIRGLELTRRARRAAPRRAAIVHAGFEPRPRRRARRSTDPPGRGRCS